MCRDGKGVKEDRQQAIKWARRAARQGLHQSQCLLGDLYYLMKERSRNRIHAFIWWSIAASQGSEEGLVRATKLEPELAESELEIAEKVALEEVTEIYGTSEPDTDEVADFH